MPNAAVPTAMTSCDPQLGACTPLPSSPLHAGSPAGGPSTAVPTATVHYVGDPMCSWCWGIAPTVEALAGECARLGLGFRLTVGGLRPGGGDAWTPEFRAFLRREWERIASVTGQPFGFGLLQRAAYDYDTEPACRAVLAVQRLAQGGDPLLSLRWFAAMQRRFYVEGDDPQAAGFYTPLCDAFGVNAAAFAAEWGSLGARQATHQAFDQVRRWGVRSFPTFLLEKAGHILPLATGHVQLQPLLERLQQLQQASPVNSFVE